MSSQEIYVSIDLGEKTYKAGKIWFHQRGARQSASFEYDPEWLKNLEKFPLEPALQLTSGAFHTTAEQILFGAIGDSAPDRWGRVLMRRAESMRAKSISIDYDDPTASIGLALSVIDEFRIKKARAIAIIKEVALAVSEWRAVATKFGLTKREIDRMASAFEHEDFQKLKSDSHYNQFQIKK